MCPLTPAQTGLGPRAGANRLANRRQLSRPWQRKLAESKFELRLSRPDWIWDATPASK